MKPPPLVALLTDTTTPGRVLPPLRWTVERHGWHIYGGPRQAVVQAAGSRGDVWALVNWLGARLEIGTSQGTPVWWGKVTRIEIADGPRSASFTLDEMANRVKAIYQTLIRGEAAETGWVEDTQSQAQFGIKEKRIDAGRVSQAQAEATRDRELDARKWAMADAPRLGNGPASEQISATLYGAGLWETLGWRGYASGVGFERHEQGETARLAFGQAATTATSYGFRGMGEARLIYDMNGGLQGFEAGDILHVSGSASNNNRFVVEKNYKRATRSRTVTTISVPLQSTYADTANGLGLFDQDDVIGVNGMVNGANNGYARVKATASTGATLTVDRANLIAEGTGASTLMQAGNTLKVAEEVFDGSPGASVTIRPHAERVAQSWTPSAGSIFLKSGTVAVRLRKRGAPTDNVTLGIYGDTAGAPGSLIEAVTVAAADIGDSATEVPFQFTLAAQQLVMGTTYWIVLQRSGSLDQVNCYEIEYDTEAGYTSGQMAVYRSGAWSAEAGWDLIFSVAGTRQSSTVLADMLTATAQGLFPISVEVASGVYVSPWRDGTQDTRSEAEGLLAAGNGTGALVAEVTASSALRVFAAPGVPGYSGADVPDWWLRRDGTLVQGDMPLAPGRCPIGIWVRLADVPGVVAGSMLERAALWFVDEAEWDQRVGAWRPLKLRGTQSVWDG